MYRITGVFLILLVGSGLIAPEPDTRFSRYFVAAESYETVAVFDVDKNDTLDIVSGDFWYEGPRFRRRHLIGSQSRFDQYYDDFSTIPMDVNGDGRMDFVTGGWFGETMRWLENPGKNERWPSHDIAKVGNVETTRAWDVDGDGTLEIVPNNPGHSLKYIKLVKPGPDTANRFRTITVAPTQDHGLGFGDINGDGRDDFIVSKGWLEAPADRSAGNAGAGAWVLHPEFSLGTASVPILVTDVNGDRLNDLIVGQGTRLRLALVRANPRRQRQAQLDKAPDRR